MAVQVALTDEQRDVVGKIEKLMRLAGRSQSEHEAASATAKAQELLAAYNLDMSAIGGEEADGARAEQNHKGGFYKFEQDVWRAVAELNFCMYWSQQQWEPRPPEQRSARVAGYVDAWRRTHKLTSSHRVLGRRVNVVATISMADYLLGAIERATRDFIARDLPPSKDDIVVGLNAALRSRRAVSFREGAAEVVTDALWSRRRDALADEHRVQREAEVRAREAGAAGASSSTALTLSSLRQSEHDANVDHLMNEPGYSARVRAERAAQAEARRRADDEAARWALAHPEEAAAAEVARREEARKSDTSRRGGGLGSRGGMGREKERDYGAYRAGERAGRDIGLDQQASTGRRGGLLT